MHYLNTKRTERGDTIIEVLIVLAVLGLAIGITYATANRSLLNARRAQENAAASKLLQSQVEALRTMAPKGITPSATNVFQAGPYCIKPVSGTDNVLPYISSPNNCLFDDRYTVNIRYSAGNNDTFTLVATWDDVSGEGENGLDSITLAYRLHP